MAYKYYAKRPLVPGAIPKPEENKIIKIENFNVPKYAEDDEELGFFWNTHTYYGYVVYEKPLLYFNCTNYELVAVKTDTVEVVYINTDSWGRYVYADENGRLWKNTECCSPRECCEERGDTLYSAAGNDFDGEPDCPMGRHIKVIYKEYEHKTYATNCICPKCGKILRTSDIPAYPFVCKECDENFFNFEVNHNGDYAEISVEMPEILFKEKRDKLQKVIKNAEADYLGFDDSVEPNVADIGWKRTPCTEQVLIVTSTLDKILAK